MNKIKIYTTWKAGSTFTRKFFTTAATMQKLNIIKLTVRGKFVPLEIFKKGNPQKEEITIKLPNSNYCAIVYRYFPLKETLNKSDIMHIIQLRNPLDILVSLYYSLTYIHPYGKQTQTVRNEMKKTTIDNFVINNSFYFEEIYKDLKISKNYKNVQYLSYDEMVINFKKWCFDALINFNLNSTQKNKLYLQFKDEFLNIKEITEEDLKKGSKKHKRKMIPGDYKSKLQQKTIEILTKQFDPYLKLINECTKQ